MIGNSLRAKRGGNRGSVAAEVCPQCRLREVLAGACCRCDLAVEVDAFWGDVEALGEEVDQLEEAAGLGGGEAVEVAVAHEADADGVAVEPVGVLAGGVGAEVLGEPAGCRVEFAIDHAVAVADDEVIAQAFEAHAFGSLVE